MPPSLPPMPTTGLGTYRPLRKVNTSLPLAYTVLAEGNRVTKPEAHRLRLSLVARVVFGVRRPGTDMNAATSWLCDLQLLTEPL